MAIQSVFSEGQIDHGDNSTIATTHTPSNPR